jgi:uncharacterized protein YjbI with pentapeptide repeats
VVSDASLSAAELSSADLREANLERTALVFSDLRFAQLDRANVDGAMFNWARLEGTSFREVTGAPFTFQGASFDDDTYIDPPMPPDRGMVPSEEYSPPFGSRFQ